MKRKLIAIVLLATLIPCLSFSQEKILDQFEKAGIWKIDRINHRCLVDPGVWARLPLDKKEQTLQAIYIEEKTWWELYDMYSGKLLGKVSSWGWKIYP